VLLSARLGKPSQPSSTRRAPWTSPDPSPWSTGAKPGPGPPVRNRQLLERGAAEGVRGPPGTPESIDIPGVGVAPPAGHHRPGLGWPPPLPPAGRPVTLLVNKRRQLHPRHPAGRTSWPASAWRWTPTTFGTPVRDPGRSAPDPGAQHRRRRDPERCCPCCRGSPPPRTVAYAAAKVGRKWSLTNTLAPAARAGRHAWSTSLHVGYMETDNGRPTWTAPSPTRRRWPTWPWTGSRPASSRVVRRPGESDRKGGPCPARLSGTYPGTRNGRHPTERPRPGARRQPPAGAAEAGSTPSAEPQKLGRPDGRRRHPLSPIGANPRRPWPRPGPTDPPPMV